ncbi:hypothetical protein R3W88_007980 [Solanum pinnatisectum]|uniref:Transcription factor n=1 Tax=Solanum pinnatisectum TaxID=50273 RepID=A0AAV9M793_9SOLN|nr:hypothetical protein R3W88_007980 [Solanum pinnatisectum]
MTHKDIIELENDEVQNKMTSQESVSLEEVRMLRQQMVEIYESWMNGQAPPSSIHDYLNTNMPSPIQVSTNDLISPPGFGPYSNTSNVAGASTVCLLSTPMMSNLLFMPIAPTNTVPQLILEPKSNNDPPPKYSFPVEAEKTIKNEEHEKVSKKTKSLEQSVRHMQGLGSHKSVSSNDLCMFPTFTYPSTTKNFCEYAIRWREQVARVKPPMKESMIDVFLQAQELDYFHYLLSVVVKIFAEVIKIGEMVENGIKSGKIISQAALKATT